MVGEGFKNNSFLLADISLRHRSIRSLGLAKPYQPLNTKGYRLMLSTLALVEGYCKVRCPSINALYALGQDVSQPTVFFV